MEAPCLMPKPSVSFTYAAAGAGWMNESRTIFRILDKATGIELATYSSSSAWFSWHHVNSWENSTHITMDITWVPNGQSILKGMSGQLLPFDWKGKLVRLTMPNPHRHRQMEQDRMAADGHNLAQRHVNHAAASQVRNA